jgi:hypothetical protein
MVLPDVQGYADDPCDRTDVVLVLDLLAAYVLRYSARSSRQDAIDGRVMNLTLTDIKALRRVAVKNDTLDAWANVILQWAEAADSEIATLRKSNDERLAGIERFASVLAQGGRIALYRDEDDTRCVISSKSGRVTSRIGVDVLDTMCSAMEEFLSAS